MTTSERARVLTSLERFGYQSQSYNILTGEKSFYFSPTVDSGVVAYVVIAGVAVVAGDPLCAEADLRDLCSEFLDFCQRSGWRCVFQAVTLRTLEQLQYIGFEFLKMGEEPFFELETFSLAGGPMRNLRRDVRRAEADGMTVIEYRPAEVRDPSLEAEMQALSDEWTKEKGSGEFEFLVGRPSLEDPGARKYFVAMLNGHVEAFCVCTPIYARNSIYFDLLRRKKRPVRGTVELLVVESFRLLKEQDYKLATLGTAPLSGEQAGDPVRGWFIEAAMDVAFNRLGYFYSFKPIYEFKDQFGPDFWEPRYLAYHPPRFNPIIVYALLKAYDPAAVRHLSQKQLAALWDGVLWLATSPVDATQWLRDAPVDSAQAIVRLVSKIPRPGLPGRPGLPDLPGLDLLGRTPDLAGRLARLGRGTGGAGSSTRTDENRTD